MISLKLARELRAAGLKWIPQANDFFAIPDRGLDDKIFVLSDILTFIERISGKPVVTFHGSAEWALDYLLTSEVVWLPSTHQLHQALIDKLTSPTSVQDPATVEDLPDEQEPKPLIKMTSTHQEHRCEIILDGEDLVFKAPEMDDAYGKALLHLLIEQV